MKRICRPNLPEGKVTEAAVGERYFKKLAGGFMSQGIKPLIIKGPPSLPDGIRDHPDVCLRHAGERTLFFFSTAVVPAHTLQGCGFEAKAVAGPLSAAYPYDAELNAALIGKTAVHNFSVTSPDLKAKLLKNGYRLLSVKQGYAACNIAIVDDRSVITSDEGIAQALHAEGIDVLRITPGYIALEGYGYGFIGGACGKLSKDCLAFTGKLDSHPDSEKIMNFLSEKQVCPIFLSDLPVFDAGGIVPLCEESSK